LFDVVDTLLSTLAVFSGLISSLKVRPENARKTLERGYLLATDLADYLVKKGEPFRSAHGIVARLVSYAAAKNKPFAELSIVEYRQFSPLFEDDVSAITIASSLAARDVPGGTAPKRVAQALAEARKTLKEPKS
ncbi:MAG: argininosuccinate lyase, partial [Dehalococcoidales bacterium]|nr:argininosuccinate lyase [Dehalococcoidales bacterium]